MVEVKWIRKLTRGRSTALADRLAIGLLASHPPYFSTPLTPCDLKASVAVRMSSDLNRIVMDIASPLTDPETTLKSIYVQSCSLDFAF